MTAPRGRTILLTGAALVPLALATPAAAEYPTGPVTLVVPFAPGGSNDIVARQLATQLDDVLGQPVVVENRPGAGATIGSAHVAAQEPDGYTILIASVTFTMNAAVQEDIPFDSRNDFTPIALIGQVPLVLGARPDIPADTPEELIAYLRERPGELSYGATGVGSIQHFAGELFNQQAGVDVQVVQYPGGGPAMTDVMGGHIEYSIGSMTQMKPQMDAGNIKGIAVTSLERSEAAPDVPSLNESALDGFEILQWWGILGPAGMDEAVVNALNEAINTVIQTEEFREFLAADGGEPRPMSAEEFASFVEENFDRWAEVAEQANIEAE
jgi:tripartite-type tricarboxylate transporter receptor subunit TctC